MSLINDMLRNLEQRHAASAPLPNEVRPLPAERPGVSWQPLVAVLAVVAIVGAGAFLALRDGAEPTPARPIAPTLPPPPPPLPAPVAAAPQLPAVEAMPAVAAPPPAKPAPAPSAVVVEKPAVAVPRRAERPAAVDTLRLDTSLPSLERARPRAAAATPQVEKSAAEADPAIQAEADLRRARELLAQGKRAEAEPLFRQGLARLPAQTDAAMTLARLQVDHGDLAGAWETLQKSLPHAQQQPSYRAFCGTVLQRLNRSREAVQHYQVALRLNPAEGRWWVGLGLALEGAGQAAEARAAFQRARAAGNLPPEMAVFAEQKSH